jgi:pimeloyl-ACP methyl ester carboxylesterase
MPQLRPLLALIAADKDRAVPPAQAEQVHAMLPPGRVTLRVMPGLGHLAHEEQPAAVAALCVEADAVSRVPASG